MGRAVVYDTCTGDIQEDVSSVVSSYSWECGINTADVLTCAVNLTNPDAAHLDLDSSATPVKNSLAILEGDTVMAAGPIWAHNYSKNTGQLDIDAKGQWSLFDHRLLMPLEALTTDLLQTTGENIGDPNPEVATTFVGKSYSYMVRRVLERAMEFPGGNLPLIFEPDKTGVHDNTVNASEFKTIGSWMEDLTQLETGPEIDFLPRLRADRQGIEFVVRVGDDGAKRLISDNKPKFDYSVPDRSIKDLTQAVNADGIISGSWASGGKPAALALYSYRGSSKLTDAGYPYTDAIDSSHNDVIRQATLNSYASENLRVGQFPIRFTPFTVRKDLAPTIAEYRKGDLCAIKIKDDPYIPDFTYTRRIVKLSGDETNWVKVTTGEVYE